MANINYDNKCNCKYAGTYGGAHAGREANRGWLYRLFLSSPAVVADTKGETIDSGGVYDSQRQRILELTRQNTQLTHELTVTRYAVKKLTQGYPHRPAQPDPRATPSQSYGPMTELLALNKQLGADLKDARSTANAYSAETERLRRLLDSRAHEIDGVRGQLRTALGSAESYAAEACNLERQLKAVQPTADVVAQAAENARLSDVVVDLKRGISSLESQVNYWRNQSGHGLVMFEGNTAQGWCQAYKTAANEYLVASSKKDTELEETRKRNAELKRDSTYDGYNAKTLGEACKGHVYKITTLERQLRALELQLKDAHLTHNGQNIAHVKQIAALQKELVDLEHRLGTQRAASAEYAARVLELNSKLQEARCNAASNPGLHLGYSAAYWYDNYCVQKGHSERKDTQIATLNEALCTARDGATHCGGNASYWHHHYDTMRLDHARIAGLLRAYQMTTDAANGTTDAGTED